MLKELSKFTINKTKSILNKRIIKDTVFVAFSNFLNSFVMFFKSLFIAGYFGASRSTDDYVFYQVFPLLVMSIFGGAISEGCLPIFKSLFNKSKEKLIKLYSDLEIIVIYVTIFITIIAFFLTVVFQKIYSHSYSKQLLIPIIFYLAIMPGSCAAICNSYFIANNQASSIANASIISNLISLIISICFSFVIGIYGIIVGWTTGHLLRYLLLRTKIRIKVNFTICQNKLKNSWSIVKEVFIIAFPIMVASSIEKLYLVVDRSFAYSLKNGRLSNLYFANSLSELPIMILISAISYVAYPKLFDWINELKQEDITEKFQKFIMYLIMISTIFIFLMSFFPHTIISIIYERGKFTSTDRIITARCLQLLTIGFISKVLYISLARVLYIVGKQKEIILIIFIPLVVKFFGNKIFINRFEIYSIASTTSLANILMLWLLFFKINTFKFPIWKIFKKIEIIAAYILLTILPIVSISLK